MTLQPLTDPWGWVRWAAAYGVTMMLMAIFSLAVAALLETSDTPIVVFGLVVFILCWAMSWTALYLLVVGAADGAISYFRPATRWRLLIRIAAAVVLVAVAMLDPIYPWFIAAAVTGVFMALKVSTQSRLESGP